MTRPRAHWLVSLAGVYFCFGALGSTWLSRIPTEQSRLHLGSGSLGVALLGFPIGSILVTVVMPHLLTRFGSRRLVRLALPCCGGALMLVSLAHGLAALVGLMVAFGFVSGIVDVAMNANGVALQHHWGSSVFGRLHASWSLGSFAGAGVGGVVTHAGVSVGAHFVAAAVLVVAAGSVMSIRLSDGIPDVARAGTPAYTSWSADPRVLVLAGVSLAAFVVEVAAGDWGGVFLRRDLHASAGLAAAAFAAFALPHFLVRLAGDPIVDRLSRRGLLVTALVVAALGYAFIVTSHSPVAGLVGLALAGAGIALVVPVCFAAAGSIPGVQPGSGVATVAGVSYGGWAAAPPVIGGVAAAAGLRIGLLLPLVLAVAAMTAVAMRRTM